MPVLVARNLTLKFDAYLTNRYAIGLPESSKYASILLLLFCFWTRGKAIINLQVHLPHTNQVFGRGTPHDVL